MREPRTSSFCTATRAVIQVVPGTDAGQIKLGDRSCERIAAWVILPNGGPTIACPLSYFQVSASLPGRWIAADDGLRLDLVHVGRLEAVTVSIFANDLESECLLPESQARRLLAYLTMDVCHDEAGYDGFDCYAFVSLLTNSLFRPADPPFQYEGRKPRPADVVVVANGSALPASIQHWALCLGEDLFISKFGKTGRGARALLETTDAAAMLSLYQCDRIMVAARRADAPAWDRDRWPVR